MRIAIAEITDFMRVRSVRIEPTADTDIILIAGENAQGKTSVLTALRAALSGASETPDDPVRHGAEGSEVFVALDDGKSRITVRRLFHADRTPAKVEVRDELGALKKPQDVLNKLIGARFMDPLAFLALKGGDQRAKLLALVDRDGTIAKLDAHRVRVFDRRTEIGRELRKLTATLDSTPRVDPGEEINVAELTRESQDLYDAGGRHKLATQRAAEAARAHEQSQQRVIAAGKALDRARAALAAAETAEEEARIDRGQLKDAKIKHEEIAEALGTIAKANEPRQAEILDKMRSAQEHNRSVAAIRAQHQQRIKLEDQAKAVAEEHAQRETELEAIDKQKADALAAAALPVAGLGVTDAAVTFNGVPLAQASSAEQLRVAVAIAAAAHPTLRDIFVRDGSLLDDRMLAALVAEARAAGVRLWVERVGTNDPGAIVIHDGKIAAPAGQVELFPDPGAPSL